MRVALTVAGFSFAFCFVVVLFQCVDSRMGMKFITNPPKVDIIREYNESVSCKTCRLKPDVGPCRANVQMWYFDPSKGDCSKFLWGGCQGNGNRFDTRDQCIDKCLKNITGLGRPRWCKLNFDYGFCFGELQRYYYDPLWKVCKSAIYSGCGGNNNNFFSFEQCESICRFGKGKIVLEKKTTGKLKKVLIINPKGVAAKQKQQSQQQQQSKQQQQQQSQQQQSQQQQSQQQQQQSQQVPNGQTPAVDPNRGNVPTEPNENGQQQSSSASPTPLSLRGGYSKYNKQ